MNQFEEMMDIHELKNRVDWHINDIKYKAPEQLRDGCPLSELAIRLIGLPELQRFHVNQANITEDEQ